MRPFAEYSPFSPVVMFLNETPEIKNNARGLMATSHRRNNRRRRFCLFLVATKVDDLLTPKSIEGKWNERGKEKEWQVAKRRSGEILEKLTDLDNTDASACSTVIPRENNFICSIKSTFPLRLYPFRTRFSDHLVKLLSFPRLGSSRHLHVMHKNIPSYRFTSYVHFRIESFS